MEEFNEDEGYTEEDDDFFKEDPEEDEIEENIEIEEEVGYEEIPSKEMEEAAYKAFKMDQDEDNEDFFENDEWI